MWFLKKYRDGVCVTTERNKEKHILRDVLKAYVDSYSTHQKKERKIYGKLIKK